MGVQEHQVLQVQAELQVQVAVMHQVVPQVIAVRALLQVLQVQVEVQALQV
jgi:hypothetical protein